METLCCSVGIVGGFCFTDSQQTFEVRKSVSESGALFFVVGDGLIKILERRNVN